MLNRFSRAGVVVGVLTLAAAAQAATPSPADFLHKVNQNSDHTLSQREVDTFAEARFDTINKNDDQTLSRKELAGRISAAGFATANTDANKASDHTISKAEFIGYVDRLFKEANGNPDGTLSVKELSTPAGLKLIQLLH